MCQISIQKTIHPQIAQLTLCLMPSAGFAFPLKLMLSWTFCKLRHNESKPPFNLKELPTTLNEVCVPLMTSQRFNLFFVALKPA